jgi:hypothetical protein
LVKTGGAKNLGSFADFPNVKEKSFINRRILPLVKINTRISDTPCIFCLVTIGRHLSTDSCQINSNYKSCEVFIYNFYNIFTGCLKIPEFRIQSVVGKDPVELENT